LAWLAPNSAFAASSKPTTSTRGKKPGESGGTTRPRDHERYGALRAVDPLTGNRKWEFRYPTSSSSGVLTTASGLVFAGYGEGNIIALASQSGKYLWHSSSASAFGLRADGPTWSTAAEGVPPPE
jgi:alcohol dehydrogenase (cytochrome c)